ncbi:hypothetical protein U9M48_040263 [Paspalum notatum var. saurae]|uniref:Reverse transcriptase domain-containing protein n=1 Tax=Paspalum notatum var. saurae TaxID=547442 RepID=A0AAQ3ULD5_PASNO
MESLLVSRSVRSSFSAAAGCRRPSPRPSRVATLAGNRARPLRAGPKDPVLEVLAQDDMLNATELAQCENGKSVNDIAASQGIRIRRHCRPTASLKEIEEELGPPRNILEKIIWDKEIEVAEVCGLNLQRHRCQRLFYLEVADEDITAEEAAPATSDDDEAPVISLLAMAGLHKPGTMHIPATIQGRRLIALLDTGSTHNFINTAALSDIDLPFADCHDLHVTVANGDKVACRGRTDHVPVDIASEQFATNFYAIPLDGFDVVLGVAFLCTLGPILWDFDQRHLSFRWEGHRVQWRGIRPVARRPHIASLAVRDQLLPDDLLDSFIDVFATPTGLPPARACDHRIHLRLGTPPVAVRPYRYAHLQKDKLERQVADMLAQGIIRPSTSAFLAPVLVKKHDQSWRFCIDYRALNDATAKDKFPFPVVDELLDELRGARFFTKLDLRSVYHQVRMHVADIEKTTFRTHHGHFEFLMMLFGLTNAPTTFQALMNDVLRPFLRRFVLVFFDDILIYSESWSAHLQHIKAVLDTLRAHSLFVKRTKCSFGAELVAYLGHVVSANSVAMDMDKVEAVASWPRPRSAHGLRGFLGLAGYYRKFIQDFGLIVAPLIALLRKDAFLWSPEAEAAFETLKRALSTAPVLQLPDFTKPFIVECDASGTGFGAVLHQGAGPLAYVSRPFTPRHLKIAAYERELIGLVQAVRHWRPYIWGRHFLICTDHLSLKFLLDQRLSPQHQWMSKLFSYDFTVEYRPGRLNTVADALSHQDVDVGEAAPALDPAVAPLIASLTVSGRPSSSTPIWLRSRPRTLRAFSYGSSWRTAIWGPVARALRLAATRLSGVRAPVISLPPSDTAARPCCPRRDPEDPPPPTRQPLH